MIWLTALAIVPAMEYMVWTECGDAPGSHMRKLVSRRYSVLTPLPTPADLKVE